MLGVTTERVGEQELEVGVDAVVVEQGRPGRGDEHGVDDQIGELAGGRPPGHRRPRWPTTPACPVFTAATGRSRQHGVDLQVDEARVDGRGRRGPRRCSGR